MDQFRRDLNAAPWGRARARSNRPATLAFSSREADFHLSFVGKTAFCFPPLRRGVGESSQAVTLFTASEISIKVLIYSKLSSSGLSSV